MTRLEPSKWLAFLHPWPLSLVRLSSGGSAVSKRWFSSQKLPKSGGSSGGKKQASKEGRKLVSVQVPQPSIDGFHGYHPGVQLPANANMMHAYFASRRWNRKLWKHQHALDPTFFIMQSPHLKHSVPASQSTHTLQELTALRESLTTTLTSVATQLSKIHETLRQTTAVANSEFKGFTANIAISNEEEVTKAVAALYGLQEDYDLGRKGRDEHGRLVYEVDGIVWLPDGRIAVVEAKQRVTQSAVDKFETRLGRVAQTEGRQVIGYIGGPFFPEPVREYAEKRGIHAVVLSGNRFCVKQATVSTCQPDEDDRGSLDIQEQQQETKRR